MTKKVKGKKIRIFRTKRNKGLEPMLLGTKGIIGYNPEIHDEDSVEFTYKLPLGAIKRLIISYFKDIQMYDEEWIYCSQSSSSMIRGFPYCNRMLGEIHRQLDKHSLNGKKIIDEVFDEYFKSDYEKMKRFKKNHGDSIFKQCGDSLCCNNSSKKNERG